MHRRSAIGVERKATICVSLLLALSALAQTHSPPDSVHQGALMITHAIGTFEVKLTPQAPEDKDDPWLARMSLDKQFHGDIEGVSKGQMLAAGSGAKGSSGGYVAIERVTGTLQHRSGTFVLQHTGTMTGGTPELSITVVPGSGTGQLAGLSGKMNIKIAGGKHSYEFDYTLEPAQ